MSGERYISETMGPGGAMFDFDNDGDLDIYIVQGQMLGPGKTPDAAVLSPQAQPLTDRLYRNDLDVRADGTRIFTAADYVPGATTSGGRQANMVEVHGSDPADGQPAMDGVRTGTQLQGRNEWTAGVGLITNEAIVTEVVFDVSSQNAEFATSGVRTNVIPKAGGNNFNFDFFGRGTTDKFASNNLTPELNVSASYVTGSHNFKAGINYQDNYTSLAYTAPGEIFTGYFVNGNPTGLLVTGNGDNKANIDMNCNCGIYAQDAWTMDRLTVNGGIRFDWFNGSVPGGTRPGGFFAPEITLPDPVVENTPNWKNTTFRSGVAYDLLGDGSTAVKFSIGKYVANEGTGVTSGFSPLNSYSLDWRNWTDLNGDDTALNPDGIPQFDEIGPSFNPNWGTGTVTRQLNPDTPRGSNYESTAGLERQLGPGWAISGMWHYRRFGEFRWTDNLNISDDDYYLSGTFTGPVDSQLPGDSSGRELPIFNLDDGKSVVGGMDMLRLSPDNWRSWKGFEVILDGELPRGGFMTASFTGGMERRHFCQTGDDNPNNLVNCDTTSPFRPMGKLSGALPLPFDTMISGNFQVLAGESIGATYTITQTDYPDLYLGGQSTSPTITHNLIEPNTEFDPYRTSLQIRFSKVITVGPTRTRVYMDASNLFNQTRVTSRNRSYGGGGVKNPDFLRIIGVERGRVLTFGIQSSF